MNLKEARERATKYLEWHEHPESLELEPDELAIITLDNRIIELEAWVNDLQSGMYINCVYCGHRYGPRKNTPVAMADVLKEHIEQCPKHPLSHMKRRTKELEAQRDELLEALQNLLKAQSGNGKIFFKALKEATAIVDKIKQSPLAGGI